MTDPAASNAHSRSSRRRDVAVAAGCGAFVALMVGMSYAAVPLYDWFCRTTGFGGTTQVATAPPGQVLERRITVRFDANVSPGLPWRFEPEVPSIEVRLGEVVTVNYLVTNLAARETFATASYNVAPLTTGSYFQKINCFCFTDQRMGAGEKREMPVVFYVDPKLVEDTDEAQVSAITLSYTFHAVRQPPTPVAGTVGKRAGRI